MRVVFVGVGRIGAAHADVVRRHPAIDSLALVDADPDRARAVAEKLGVEAAADVDEAMARADAMVVTAPTAVHPDMIVRSVRRGIPVFCEKPVATDVAGHQRVLAEVTAAGVPVQIGFQRRFDAGYGAVRRAVAAGELGELRRVHLVTADPVPPPSAYIAVSGGIYRDLHVHDFDIVRWVTGREVVEVYALGVNRGDSLFGEAGDVDESVVLLTLDDGTLATCQGSRYNGAGYDVRMDVAGTRATWSVGLDDRTPILSAEPGVEFPEGSAWPNFWERFTPAYVAEINAFVELVEGRRDNPCPVAEALEAFYVAEAATRSRLERHAVTIAEVRAA